MNEVRKALGPVKNRIRRNRLLRGAAAGLAAGFGTAAALQAVSFFIPVPDRGLWAAVSAAAVLLVTALANALRPVCDTEAAEAADACGLQERAVTALEMNKAAAESPEGSIRTLQRRDACAALEGLDVRKIRPGSVKKALFAALGCAAVLVLLILVPSPKDSQAAAGKALRRTLREGRETVAKAAEEDERSLTEEAARELRRITADLDRELSGSRDAADALVALDRAEQRVEQLRQQTAGDAAAAADNAEGNGEGRTGENGQNGTAQQNASAQAGNGQQGSMNAGRLSAQMMTAQALASLKAAVNPSAQTGMLMQGMPVGMSMQGGTQGIGASGAGGQGKDGKTGGGAGEGSTNREESGGAQQSGVHFAGSRDPQYKEAEYETIYDPERIDKARRDEQTNQNRLSDEETAQLETGPGRGSLGGDVPWGEALQDYAETEARSAERENLTTQERQWVNEYYRLLTEQQ